MSKSREDSEQQQAAAAIMGLPQDFDFRALPEGEMNALDAAFSEEVKSIQRNALADALAEGATPEDAELCAADIRGQYVQMRHNDNDRTRSIWAYYVIAIKRGATPEEAEKWTAAYEESLRLEDEACAEVRAEEQRCRTAEFPDEEGVFF